MTSRREFLKISAKQSLWLTALSLIPERELLAQALGTPSRLDALKSTLQNLPDANQALLFTPDFQQYVKLRNGYNLRTQSQPKAVLVSSSEESLIRTLEWSEQNQTPIHIRSGGHSYEGYSSGPGIVLHLGSFDHIEIDAARKIARVGAGARIGAINRALASQGFMIPMGTCPAVGIGGLTLGGGFGMSSRRLGLTSDNMIGARILTARGQILEISSEKNADLLWACRGGGGGNFGLVTEFTFRIYPIQEALVYSFKVDPAATAQFLKTWQEVSPKLADEISILFNISGASGRGLTSARCHGQVLPNAQGLLPNTAQVQTQLAPLLRMAIPNSLSLQKRSYLEATRYFSGSVEAPAVYFKGKSDIAKAPLSEVGIQSLVNALSQLSYGVLTVSLDAYGGILERQSETATAYSHRKGSLFGVQYFAQWNQPSQSEPMVRMMNQVKSRMEPHFSGSAYVNYIDSEVKDWAPAYYGKNLERLLTVKTSYDPKNLFSTFAQALRARN